MQFEWNSKDSVSFGLYKEVFEENKVNFFIWLESDNREVNLKDLRTGKTEYRLNNFTIKENSDNNTVTFCPNIAGCPAYFRINSDDSFRMIIKKKDGSIENETEFQAGETKLELNPINMRMYKVVVEDKEPHDQVDDSEVIKEAPSVQEESIPEFFGGSFQSDSEENADSSSLKRSDDSDIIADDATIFTGGFNSDTDSDLSTDTNSTHQQSNSDQQSTESIPSIDKPLFADMFPTSGTESEKSIPQQSDIQEETEPAKRQAVEQNADSGVSSDVIQQSNTNMDGNTQSTGNVSGFSVPFVETEGIRERRESVQELQQDNDRTAQEVEDLEKQISELEDKSRQLSDKKSSLIAHLEQLQREYDKDYSKFQEDLDDIKGRYTVDQSILEYYEGEDFNSVEDLLKQTEDLLHRVEEQIRLFVTAQQNKTDEIEKSLKVGKKE